MPPVRAKMIALAAAACGISGEMWIQNALTESLLAQAAHDYSFSLMLMRTAGIDWESLQEIAKQGAAEGQQP
jgi:hypothetical protein